MASEDKTMNWKDFVDVILFRDIRNKLDKILKDLEKLMSASQDVLDAVALMQASADNIAADIQKLLASQTADLSPEAKQALSDITAKLKTISDVVPD